MNTLRSLKLRMLLSMILMGKNISTFLLDGVWGILDGTIARLKKQSEIQRPQTIFTQDLIISHGMNLPNNLLL